MKTRIYAAPAVKGLNPSTAKLSDLITHISYNIEIKDLQNLNTYLIPNNSYLIS